MRLDAIAARGDPTKPKRCCAFSSPSFASRVAARSFPPTASVRRWLWSRRRSGSVDLPHSVAGLACRHITGTPWARDTLKRMATVATAGDDDDWTDAARRAVEALRPSQEALRRIAESIQMPQIDAGRQIAESIQLPDVDVASQIAASIQMPQVDIASQLAGSIQPRQLDAARQLAESIGQSGGLAADR
jgi:hypothetical protein